MSLEKKVTIRTLNAMKKNHEKIVMLTSYDAVTARWAESAGCQMILVGDSMGNTVLGYKNTLPVTLEESLAHTAAVCRGAQLAFVVGDMPFMSYQGSIDDAVINAGRYLKEAGADAIKLEGGHTMLAVIKRMTSAGIPVMGHIGLMPQSVLKDGGYRIHGKSEEEAKELMDDALALQDAGCFSIVLEGVPAELSKRITDALHIPTIGIGAGADTDGQVQVIADLLGYGGGYLPKHAKNYANLNEIALNAVAQYVNEVQQGKFPTSENAF